MLCKNCADADIRGAISGDFILVNRVRYIRRRSDLLTRWEPKKVGRLKGVLISCALCCFKPRSLEFVSKGDYGSEFSIRLGPSRTGMLTLEKDAVGAGDVRYISPYIQDFQRIKELVQQLRGNGDPSIRHTNDLFQAPIKVLDCFLHKVIEAPPFCDYVTLSYVWGSPNSKPLLTSFTKFHRIPRTIADAITVTSKLGYRYLWIDRLCIDQLNPDEVHHQISQMDQIYRKAQVCIVAMVGSGSHHGLAGVSIPRAHDQKRVSIDGIRLLSSPQEKPTEAYIAASAWAKRAWTFQEMLFSKTRIFFTEQEVFLQVSQGEEYFYYRERTGFHRVHENKKHPALIKWPPFQPLIAIYEHISVFALRELSFPSDILRALTGMFHAYQSLDPPILQIWGIPFENRNMNLPESFLYGLGWRHEFPQRSKRRHGFPSWSWAGWHWHYYSGHSSQRVVFPNDESYDRYPYVLSTENPIAQTNAMPTVFFTTVEGEKISLHDAYQRMINHIPVNISPVIIFSTWSIPIQITRTRYKEKYEDTFQGHIKHEQQAEDFLIDIRLGRDLGDGAEEDWENYDNELKEKGYLDCVAVLILPSTYGSNCPHFFLILHREVDDQSVHSESWERMTTMEIQSEADSAARWCPTLARSRFSNGVVSMQFVHWNRLEGDDSWEVPWIPLSFREFRVK
jgi:hypothetical protein